MPLPLLNHAALCRQACLQLLQAQAAWPPAAPAQPPLANPLHAPPYSIVVPSAHFPCRDKQRGFQLYQSDPSGNYGGWKATAIGANHQAATNVLQVGGVEGPPACETLRGAGCVACTSRMCYMVQGGQPWPACR